MRRGQYGYGGGRTSASRQATVGTRSKRERILIVCEGTRTETNYFKSSFKVSKVIAEIRIEGTGRNTMSLIKATEALEEEQGPFDAVWCVFDRDSFPPDNFDNAVASINSKDGYHTAYSNESFELWFILHFEHLQSAVGRDDYNKRLAVHLGFRYEKNDPRVPEVLRGKGSEAQAIQRAKTLLGDHPEMPPSGRCPSTTVYELVEKLRSLEKEAGL